MDPAKLYLQMWIGGILVAKVELEYEGMDTCDQRQQHQENLASELRQKHWNKIIQAEQEPLFFIENVQSKLNEL